MDAVFAGEDQEFILISNEPFINNQNDGNVKKKKREQLVFNYDRSKQILLAYDKKTAAHLNMEDWTPIDKETIIRKMECQIKWLK